MITMYDSISVGSLPAGAEAYAGYTDGAYANASAIQARFPHAKVLTISVYAGGPGSALDVEPFDATNSQAATKRYAVYYTSASNAAALVNMLTSYGIFRNTYKLWTAHYTGVAHICGPTSCGYPAVADGTQYASNNDFDTSILDDDFFGATASSQSVPTTKEADDMTPAVAQWTDPKGNVYTYYAVRGANGVIYHLGPETKNLWQDIPNTNCQSGVAMTISKAGQVVIAYVNTSGVPCVVVRQPGESTWSWGSLGGNVG